MENNVQDAFSKLYKIIEALRSEDGCPWDKEQTPMSLRHCIVEETFEACDAIVSGDSAHVREELGDVIFDVLLCAYTYEQAGDFSIKDVLNDVSEKIVRRHPHVFGSDKKGCNTIQDINKTWDAIKDNVEGRKKDSVLDSVPEGFPPLLKAGKLISKARKKSFDWSCIDDCIAKVLEELDEVKAAENEVQKEEELGDLLFSVVDLCKMYNVDPCLALERTNRKFAKRFRFVEKSMEENGISMDKTHLKEMLAFWNEAKKK